MPQLSHKDLSDNVRYIALSGYMDMKGTEAVEKSVTDLIAGNNRKVIIDLSDVTFLASVGIRLLIASGKQLKKNGGSIAMVVGQNAAVIKTVKATCGDAVFPLCETQDKALAALNA